MANTASPFFDEVHLWTFKKSHTKEKALLAHRVALRRARRFRVDISLARHIRELAEDPSNLKRFPEWIKLARLPYESVWLENEAIEDDISFRHGYLLRRDPGSSTRWVCHGFMTGKAIDGTFQMLDRVAAKPISFVIDTEGESKTLACESFVTPLTTQFPKLLTKSVEDEVWAAADRLYRTDSSKPLKTGHPWYRDHVYITSEPTSLSVYKSISEYKPDEFHRRFAPLLGNLWRDIRTLILTLAIINDVPVLMTNVTSGRGSMNYRQRQVPYLDHTVIGLKIPAKRPVPWLRRRLDHSVIRKRAHEVRGHWRTYLDRSTGDIHHRTWIEAHQRGDASLGFVKHDYFVEES